MWEELVLRKKKEKKKNGQKIEGLGFEIPGASYTETKARNAVPLGWVVQS